MEMKAKLLLVGGVFLILAFAFFFFNDAFTGNVIQEIPAGMDKFITCLNNEGVVMYGFANNPSSEAQLSLFGVYSENVSVIDCHNAPENCEGVIIYPSWRVEGRIISSGLSLGMLSDLSGCKL
jgi:hypothetical protein